MKSGPACVALGVALVLSGACCSNALRTSNSTKSNIAARKFTGLLCREPKTNKEGDDLEVILEEGDQRSLLFSRTVKDSKGNTMGREVAGMQSTVHCTTAKDAQCLPADLGKPVPTCKEVGQQGACACTFVENEPLKLHYQAMMAAETLKRCEAKAKTSKEPLRVLMFGLGGGAVPMYIRRHCESALVESVESDTRVALIAQRLMGFKADNKNKVEIADAEEAAQRHVATKPWPKSPHYDVVLVDCFDGENRVAPSCRSERFIHAIHTVLGSDALVLHNVIDTDMKQLLPMYEATFGSSTTKQKVQNGQFLIVATTHTNHPGHA